jgi:hypothetical protein
MFCRNDVDQLMTLTREICALKLSESQLLADKTAASSLADSRALRIHHLELELARMKDGSAAKQPSQLLQYLTTSCKNIQDQALVSDLHAQLAQKDHELYTLRCELVEEQQRSSRADLLYAKACEDVELQKMDMRTELQKAEHKLASAHEEWNAEAQRQQHAVAQQLMAADSRSRELMANLSHQVSFWKVIV